MRDRSSLLQPRTGLIGIAAIGVLTLGVSSCANHAAGGYLQGRAHPCSGPGPTIAPDRSLTISVRQGGRRIAQVNVKTPFEFKFALKPGSYIVVAPGDAAVGATVRAGRTTRIVLYANCG